MANFIKDAIAELEHVVWPTHIETKKFFQAVVSIIVAMTLFTYLLTLAFSNALFATRAWINAPKDADLSGSPVVSGEPIQIDPSNINIQTADGTPVTVTQ